MGLGKKRKAEVAETETLGKKRKTEVAETETLSQTKVRVRKAGH